MKKFIIPIICVLIINTVISNIQASEEANYDYYYQDFLVSAYYSPLPNQTRYLREDYEKEIKLNGRGTNGADGTPVYMGMLAAPKSYSFGTKIELPGLGIGTVNDRGGAIREKENYHRIDVWMGYGDQGLTRALNWGMRHITGKVYFDKNSVSNNLDYTVISAYSPQVNKTKTQNLTANLITKTLNEGMIDPQVIKLKEAMKTLGYFSGETQNNYFDTELKNSVIRFQIDKKLISSKDEYGAGYVGIKTQEILKDSTIEITQTIKSPDEKIEKTMVSIQTSVSKNSSDEDIRELQLVLQNLNYYSGEIDGKYSEKMIAAILAFQKDNGIINNQYEDGAGYYGPKTKEALLNVIKNREKKYQQFPLAKSEIFIGDDTKENLKVAIVPKKINFPASKANQIVTLKAENEITYIGKFASNSLASESQIIQIKQINIKNNLK